MECLTCLSGKFKPAGVQRTSPHESLSHKVGHKSGNYHDSVAAKPHEAHLNAVFYSSGRFGPAILIVFFGSIAPLLKSSLIHQECIRFLKPPTANPQDLKCCAEDGRLWIVSTVFRQGYFIYLLPFFKKSIFVIIHGFL